ncbi:MAG: polyprenyl synthetase family protein [Candidatus Latescibacterota bacterium]
MRAWSEMQSSKIYQSIQGDLDRVEDLIRDCLVIEDERIKPVSNCLLGASGKRLRPVFVLLSSRIGGQRGERAIDLAAAIELIHTASLVHDDVIDKADVRRKRSTVNATWGNEVSVLFGDYIYSRAFYLLGRIEKPEILAILSRATSVMCEGEMIQIAERGHWELSETAYLSIIEKKTASLFAACCESGALLGGADAEQVKALSRYGTCFGIAFQILDDCLDMIGEEKDLGKSLGSDLEGGKTTLPLILLLNALPEKEKQKVMTLLESRDRMASQAQIREMAQEYGAMDRSLEKASAYVEQAKEEVAALDECSPKEGFLNLADMLFAGA